MDNTILLVDDDEDIVSSMTAALTRRGYRVLQASDGKAALNILHGATPALIITDILMPEMDGFHFYKMLKNDPLLKDIAVLIMSGRGAMEGSFRVLGVDDFIVKPFSPEDLFSKVAEILSKKESVLAQGLKNRTQPFHFCL